MVRAVQHMRENKCKFRVLGLSATPGADGAKVQVRGEGSGAGWGRAGRGRPEQGVQLG